MNYFLKLIYLIIIVYVLFCIVLFLNQKKMIYFPTKISSIEYENLEKVNKIYKLRLDNQVLGYEIKKNDIDEIIVIFHGNARDAISRSYYLNLFKNKNLFLAEYPGFGENFGEDITKEKILTKAEKTVYELSKKYKNIILVGESLGTGIASFVATKVEIKKLILITPYDSILNVASEKFPYIPLKYLLTENFDNVDYLKNYKNEVIILISENDEVIKPKFAINLSKKINSKIIMVKNSNHNNWYENLTEEDLLLLNKN